MSDPIVIVSAARTPIGGLLGDFAGLAAWELGGVAVKAAVERARIPGDAVDEVLLGNCLMAGQGQASDGHQSASSRMRSTATSRSRPKRSAIARN